MTYEEKLASLQANSVWIFTKQETDFDESFKAAKLFDEIPNRETENIESYFAINYARYAISTARHRILVIPQFYGLMTKTPFYERGGHYNAEKVTDVYNKIALLQPGSREYNILKTEQVLKLKIHAIIDTAQNNTEYSILPVVFIYKVLRGLKERYGVERITLQQLYTHVMTCRKYGELDDAIKFIYEDAPVSDLWTVFKDRSRVLTCIQKNINLFIIKDGCISINEKFDDYFFNNFIQKYDLEELHAQLERDVDYSYFLYNVQDFNVNLIDEPNLDEIRNIEKPQLVSAYIQGDDESTYLQQVDDIKENNVNDDVVDGAYETKPVEVPRFNVSRRFRTNPLLGKVAIKRAYYHCERNFRHETFLSRKTNKKYMEAHHLVPVKFQQEMWERFHVNIDCVENLISLCPTCHKAIHLGTREVQDRMIEELFRICEPKYNAIGFMITLDEVKELYHRSNV